MRRFCFAIAMTLGFCAVAACQERGPDLPPGESLADVTHDDDGAMRVRGELIPDSYCISCCPEWCPGPAQCCPPEQGDPPGPINSCNPWQDDCPYYP